MAAKFKPGMKVRQVMPAPVEGTVVGFALDQTTGDLTYHVASVDAEGHIHARFFQEHDIEAAPAEEKADA